MIGMMYRPLSDMESNGVYFEREEETQMEESLYHYSGLPSVESYEEDYHIGHS
jgi:hypothetical protein